MVISIKKGDLVKAKETYVCHQCNCVTNRSAFLAKTLFNAFPYADVYSQRTEPSTPGTITLRGNGQDQRYIVALFSQYYPGKTKYPNSPKDGWDARLSNFKKCLNALKELPDGSFAFPWLIGCGAAGGNWDDYLSLLEGFARVRETVIYRLDSPAPACPQQDLF